MSAAVAMQAITPDRRKSCWLGTPEIYFRKSIDNSRLVKVEDPRREREMRIFSAALVCLFCLSWPTRATFPRHRIRLSHRNPSRSARRSRGYEPGASARRIFAA